MVTAEKWARVSLNYRFVSCSFLDIRADFQGTHVNPKGRTDVMCVGETMRGKCDQQSKKFETANTQKLLLVGVFISPYSRVINFGVLIFFFKN